MMSLSFCTYRLHVLYSSCMSLKRLIMDIWQHMHIVN